MSQLNRRALDWCKDTQLEIWKEQELLQKALLLRKKASEYWRKAELRRFYPNLDHMEKRSPGGWRKMIDMG